MGNLTSMTDMAGTLSYAYNAVNLVTTLVEPGGATTTFGYDNDDNRTATAYPNGVTQGAGYDASSRLTLIEGKRGATTLTRFAYTYTMPATTDTGLRRTVTDAGGNVTAYGYDGLDRLTSAVTKDATGATTADHAYAYDPAGNRTSDTFNGVATTAYFNDADQLTSRGAVGYSYDANGNQTASSAGQAMAYNAADQTTSLAKAGGSPLTASYAGLGQVERTTAGPTSFTNTLLGLTAATEAGATTATTRDPAGGLVGLRSGTGRSYYLFDGLGSVAALTDGSGSVTHSYAYDPYGVTTETTSSSLANPWRYTGQYQDVATGLYKMGARYYQPDLGRWTQQDPSGQDANSYLYAGGNPASFVDPSGLSFFSEFKDYLTAADADKANDDPAYNNRFSSAEATASEGVRDAGEFIGRNGPTAYKYGVACLQYGVMGAAASTNTDTPPGSLRLPERSLVARLVLGLSTSIASNEQYARHEEVVTIRARHGHLRCSHPLRED